MSRVDWEEVTKHLNAVMEVVRIPLLGWRTALEMVAPHSRGLKSPKAKARGKRKPGKGKVVHNSDDGDENDDSFEENNGIGGSHVTDLLWQPSDVVNTSEAQLEISLEADKRPTKAVRVVKELAQWWVQYQIDEQLEIASDSKVNVRLSEEVVESLQQIKGISRESATRIRLFALGEDVFPIGRAAMRVGCRHGWLDLSSEFDEWQSLLRHWATMNDLKPQKVTLWLDAIGADWCGPRPKCTGCPLESFLPPHGPIEDETN